MRRYLVISIFLICLLKMPWQSALFDTHIGQSNFERSNSATTPSPTLTPPSPQKTITTVIAPTEKPIKTPHVAPTRTPRPTALPPEIPPPTDRRLLHSMILFGVIACLTIVFGVWTNRLRNNLR